MTFEIDRTEVSTDKSPVILWDNLFTQGTLSASSEATDGEKENATDENTFDYWTPSSLPANLTVTLGSATTAAYAGIAAHNLGTNGNTLSVEYNDGVDWVELASITPSDDTTIMLAFDETSSDQFRFYISGGTAPSIGVAFIGDGLRFDSGILPGYTPLYMSDNVELLKSQSLDGQFITNRVNRRGANSSFDLNILERSFVEGATFQNFRKHYNDGKTFFFASNPSELEDDVAYCWRQDGGEIKPTFANDGIFYNTRLSLEAYIGS